MQTPAELYAQADALEEDANRMATTDLGETQRMWAQADKLRAKAAEVEALTIDWQADLPRRVHEAALVALGCN